MRRIFSTVVLLQFCSVVLAQNPNEGFGPQIPSVLPASPDASAIVKDGNVGSSLFTGAAQASIPIYEMKVGSFSIPIGLNYNSSGFRVDELPSRAGLGWSISGGGVITRTINDYPDDEAGSTPGLMPSGLSPTDQRNWYFYNLVHPPDADTEADEFFVSAPGLTTKFVFDNAGNAVQFPYSKIKIEVVRLYGLFNTFIITRTDGTKYEFGYVADVPGYGFEVAQNRSINAGFDFGVRTGYYLRRITLPTGQTITYTYTGASTTYRTGVSQQVTRGVSADNCSCNTAIACPSTVAQAADIKTVLHWGDYLMQAVASITSSDGQQVNFSYEPVSDVPDVDIRLHSVEVVAGAIAKKYELSYVTPELNLAFYKLIPPDQDGEPEENPRFFLTGVQWYASATPAQIVGRYALEYQDFQYLPRRFSFCQDQLGYFNGKNNDVFLAATPGESTEWGYAGSADRSFDWNSAKRGMLKKITYPTGGTDELIYEANTVADWEPVGTTVTYINMNETGVNDGSGAPIWQDYESSSFVIGRDQMVAGSFSVIPNATCSCSLPSYPLHPVTAKLFLVNTATNEMIPLAMALGFPSSSLTIDAFATAGTYKLLLQIRGLPVHVDLTFAYDPATAPTTIYGWMQKEAGGVRVKQVLSTDPITGSTNSRYFNYASKDIPTKSSGIALKPAAIREVGLYKVSCPSTLLCSEGSNSHIECPTSTLLSSSIVPLFITEGSHMMYSHVVESNDPTFANGGIEHEFSIETPRLVDIYLNDEISSIPPNLVSTTRGNEIKTSIFDANKNNVKVIENVYDDTPPSPLTKQILGRKFRLRYSSGAPFFDPVNPLQEFDETRYYHESSWQRLQSSTFTEYSSSGTLVSTQTYTYNDAGPHTNPVKVETLNSKQLLTATETKYPTDFTSNPVYQSMVDRNLLDLPIEVVQKENSVQLLKTTTNYKDWFNDETIIAPEIVKFKNGSYPEESRVQFYGYDTRGNILQLAKQNDGFIRYIWDYNQKYPVAEAKNASGNIAYTSFEADGSGNWSGVDPLYINSSADALTGNKYYSHYSFDLSVAGSAASSYYYITYWKTTSGAYSVSSEIGSGQLLKTLVVGSKTWRLYKHKVPGNTAIHITGSGDIDELRFYPEGSMMVTYTYAPFAGISTQADMNQTLAYYEYDQLGRLSLVRDEHKNIVRKICYNYKGEIERCGVVVYGNEPQSGSFNAICNCVAGNAVTYTVPANTYTSTNSVAEANALAAADVAANGQAFANSTGCPRGRVYARIEATSTWAIVPSYYATLVIRFYCDAAYTIPIQVHDLNVNWRHHKTWCNEVYIPIDHVITCNGYETPLGTFTLESGGVNMTCYTVSLELLDGSGYNHP